LSRKRPDLLDRGAESRFGNFARLSVSRLNHSRAHINTRRRVGQWTDMRRPLPPGMAAHIVGKYVAR
jgi:hypothetical protein